MEEQDRQRIVSNILSGDTTVTVNNSTYIIRKPTTEQLLLAQIVYDDILARYKYDGMMTDEDTFNVLVLNGFIKLDYEATMKKAQENLDSKKVELFKLAAASKKEQEAVRKTIRMIKQKIDEQIEIRHSFDYFTLNGFAQWIRNRYLTSLNVYDKAGTKIENPDNRLVDVLTRYRLIAEPSLEELREIARNEPWVSYWRVGGFETLGCAGGLSHTQKNMLLVSKMYDNAYAHPDCPSDAVIEDDDMFDGWMIEERRKQEAEKGKKTVEQSFGPQSDHDEVFVMAKEESGIRLYHDGVREIHATQTEEEFNRRANEINSLNSFEASLAKRQRAAAIEQLGRVEELDLPDVRQEYQIAKSKALSQAMKGKK